MANGKIVFNRTPMDDGDPRDRIVTEYQQMKKFIDHCRGLGLRIVLTQGTFDMVHIGHGRYLTEAKRHGDLLLVGIDNDEKVRKRKGPERPVVPEDERLEMLTHLRPVDLVFLKKLRDPKWKLIKTVQPDVLIVIKENYNQKQIRELKKYCGEVRVLPRQATTSTSAKLRLMQMGVAHQLGKALTPKVVSAIEEALSEVKNGGKTEKKQTKKK